MNICLPLLHNNWKSETTNSHTANKSLNKHGPHNESLAWRQMRGGFRAGGESSWQDEPDALYISKLDQKTTVMCSMMFCKQMRLTYVMLAFLRDSLINNIKMGPRLSSEKLKAILKWYWRTENVVEVQRKWWREYETESPTRSGCARIMAGFSVVSSPILMAHWVFCRLNRGQYQPSASWWTLSW